MRRSPSPLLRRIRTRVPLALALVILSGVIVSTAAAAGLDVSYTLAGTTGDNGWFRSERPHRLGGNRRDGDRRLRLDDAAERHERQHPDVLGHRQHDDGYQAGDDQDRQGGTPRHDRVSGAGARLQRLVQPPGRVLVLGHRRRLGTRELLAGDIQRPGQRQRSGGRKLPRQGRQHRLERVRPQLRRDRPDAEQSRGDEPRRFGARPLAVDEPGGHDRRPPIGPRKVDPTVFRVLPRASPTRRSSAASSTSTRYSPTTRRNASKVVSAVALPKVLTLRKTPYTPRAAANPVLRWDAIRGATYYHVQLFRERSGFSPPGRARTSSRFRRRGAGRPSLQARPRPLPLVRVGGHRQALVRPLPDSRQRSLHRPEAVDA